MLSMTGGNQRDLYFGGANQVVEIYFEGCGNFKTTGDGNVLFTTLNDANVGAVESGFFGKGLLRVTQVHPLPAYFKADRD